MGNTGWTVHLIECKQKTFLPVIRLCVQIYDPSGVNSTNDWLVGEGGSKVNLPTFGACICFFPGHRIQIHHRTQSDWWVASRSENLCMAIGEFSPFASL